MERGIMMSKFKSFEEMKQICEEINASHIPDGSRFDEAIDDILSDEESTADEVVANAYRHLLQTVDAEIETIEGKMKLSPTCRKGCAHCCYFPIIVTRLEAKLIWETMKQTMGEVAARQKITTYVENYKDKLSEITSLDFRTDADFKYKYISAQLPCPLLDTETNTCVTYDVRPIPCRTYLNYANPQVCADDLVPKEPFSYEFLYRYYMDGLHEVIEALLYGGEEVSFNYPFDLMEYDYLPNLLQEELKNEQPEP
jgi:uncharacterized protein